MLGENIVTRIIEITRKMEAVYAESAAVHTGRAAVYTGSAALRCNTRQRQEKQRTDV